MLSNLNSLARGLALVLAVAALAGCATSKEKLLTHGDRTMMDIWQQETATAWACLAVGATVVYLASDESSFTTGHAHVIDGGWSNI